MAAYPSEADRRPVTGIEELLEVRMHSDATGAKSLQSQTPSCDGQSDT